MIVISVQAEDDWWSWRCADREAAAATVIKALHGGARFVRVDYADDSAWPRVRHIHEAPVPA